MKLEADREKGEEPSGLIDLNEARRQRTFRRLARIGQSALQQVINGGELSDIGVTDLNFNNTSWVDINASDADTHASNELLDATRQTALRIYAEGGLTAKGVASFMLHGNKNLQDFTPLDMCLVGEPQLAVEAGLCFVDAQRKFGQDVENFEARLKLACTKLPMFS